MVLEVSFADLLPNELLKIVSMAFPGQLYSNYHDSLSLLGGSQQRDGVFSYPSVLKGN